MNNVVKNLNINQAPISINNVRLNFNNSNRNNPKTVIIRDSATSSTSTTPKNSKKNRSPPLKVTTTPTLVIATNSFISNRYEQLDIQKGEYLVVTDWKSEEEGWVYGHRKDNKDEKGLFPKLFIKVCDENKESNSKRNTTKDYKISFANKERKFRSRKDMKLSTERKEITINRNNLFEDAFKEIMKIPMNELKYTLRIKYENERGVDCGGLLRDFFYELSKEIGCPNYALLKYINENSYELDVNPMSGFANNNHLKYFRFIGRLMGLAIMNNHYLSVNFSKVFYKKLLEIPLEFSDLEFVDYDLYKNINWLRNYEGAENLCLTFEVTTDDCFGNKKVVELKPNGSEIPVTDANKEEYINLITKYKISNFNDKEQFKSIREGFYEVIPKDFKKIFNDDDFNLLLCGTNEIDVCDWENNTDYEGYDKNSITVINFWRCVKEFDDENRRKLLLFATGNSQVPISGFKNLRGNNQIQHFKLKNIGDINEFPKSHTCFNRIDLPPYTSYTTLKQKLLFSITEGIGSFEMS